MSARAGHLSGLRSALLFALLGCAASTTQKPTVVGPPPADPRAARLYLEGVKLLAQPEPANTARAASRFEEALRIDPNLWEAHYNLGVLLVRGGEARQALPHLTRAHQIQEMAGEPLIALAAARHELGEREAAAALLDQYLRAHPDATEVRLSLTAVLREAGSYEAALAQARTTLVRDPANTQALLEVSRIYRAKGELDVAELVLQKVLALDPKSATAHNDLGLLGLARGDAQLAFEHFDKAVGLAPVFTPARMNRASVLLHAGDYSGAQAEYEKVLDVDAHLVDARVGLGVALRGLGKHPQAEAAYQAALADSPNHPAALFDLAVLRAEFLGQPADSRKLFERYLEVAATDAAERKLAERYLSQIPAAPEPPPASATQPTAAEPPAKQENR